MILLMRHAEALVVPDLGRDAWPLTDAGRHACAARAGALLRRGLSLQRILSSPQRRARETAEIMADAIGIEVVVRDALREQASEDLPFLDGPDFETRVSDCFARPDDPVLGDETMSAAIARLERELSEAVRIDHNIDSLVISHGRIMAGWLATWRGEDAFRLWRKLAPLDWFELRRQGSGWSVAPCSIT